MTSSRIVFWGTPQFVVPVLSVLEQNFNLIGIVTAPDKPVGRKQVLTPSPVKTAYQSYVFDPQKHQLPVILTPEKLDQEIIEKLKELQPDLFVVAAYGKIISKEILAIPKYGALNIHPSLLPKYRGPSPIQAAILNGPASPDELGASRGGDKESAVTIIQMDEKMDHGPVVAQKKIGLSDQETFEGLAQRMFQEAAKMLVEIIPEYINWTEASCGESSRRVTLPEGFLSAKEFPLRRKLTERTENWQGQDPSATSAETKPSFKLSLPPQPQDETQATYCPMINKESGYFDIDNSPNPEKLDRMIRAYYPWPGVWTRWNGKIVKFYPKGAIQMEGKKPVSLETFLNGYPEAKTWLAKLFPDLQNK